MNKIFVMMFFLTTIMSNAQIIYPLQGSGSRSQPGAHYKDVEDIFSKFVGVWKYEEQNKIFIIEFRKKEAIFDEDNNNYFDLLIGEYKYISNGLEVINTLPNFDFNLKPYENNIAGMVILDRNLPAEERKVILYLNDPEREYLNRKIIVKHIPAFNGTPEKIQLEWTGDMSIIPDDTSPTTLRVPEENYILVKQP